MRAAPLHRSPTQSLLDLAGIARQRPAHQPRAVLGHQHHILDADADALLGYVDARLHCNDIAFGERLGEIGGVVYVQPDMMADAVREVLSQISARDEKRLAWLRQVVEWQREVPDPNEFLSTLKIDLYPEEVYTFTPKGKIVF